MVNNNVETYKMKMKQETTDKSAKVQEQVNEVKVVMEQNVADAMSRGEQLNDLEAKTLALEEGSKSFAKNTNQVSSNLWWKNVKYTAIIVGIIVLVVLFLLFLTFGSRIFDAIFSSSSR